MTAPAEAPVLGLLDGRPLPRTGLDRRLAALRSGPRAAALPAPGSGEDRQLARWVAQVLLTEALCEAVAAERGLAVRPEAAPARLDQQAAVELGSITAAAYEGSAAVRAVCAEVTAGVEPSAAEVAHYRALTEGTERPPVAEWRLALPDGSVLDAAPDTLPLALCAALRAAAPGERVTAGGWTATRLATVPAGVPETDPSAVVRAAARRAAFVRWLDHARAGRLTLVPGLEHPGDPAQPDNHHRH
ncbi:DUF7158 domain-containing protein [Kitasatospora purpeofusca]|uniref:DUF7158 domain-containing protein n=1 Tax=Kitasatospora purpeofusca TaxID=67352 RepID=UPI002251753C|nr:hypothetical protein [Kitasatospora purpeofusca]MCX4758883.1 hypothetical protein [Kitasatospora purpeofusca]WSR30693.1 hypothetical protein OG715_06765 [Kitasatospora purpeofusca]WSR38933.1 hypothetical protein OG196_07415 [Kitasatospora purpeofusca]